LVVGLWAQQSDDVVKQLRESGFTEDMIQKIMAKNGGKVTTTGTNSKESVYPDVKSESALSTESSVDTVPPNMIAQANTGKKKKKVLTIEELYGDDLYQNAEQSVKPAILRPETTYYPGILSTNLSGSTGLFQLTTAYCLPRGKFAFGTHFVYNTITRQNDKDINFLTGEYAREYYIPITATFGILDNLELGFSFPGQSWKINASELKPSNDSGSGMGDVEMRMKYKLPIQESSKSSLAIGFGTKFPTADKEEMYVMGATGEADYEIFGVLSQALSHANVHINVGYVFTGDPKSARAGENLYIDDKFKYNIGVDFSKMDDLTLSFELNGENWGAMGSKLEFTPGIRTLVRDSFVVEAGLPITIFNDEEFGYDFKAIMGATYIF